MAFYRSKKLYLSLKKVSSEVQVINILISNLMDKQIIIVYLKTLKKLCNWKSGKKTQHTTNNTLRKFCVKIMLGN